jgi:hypothetical protein
MPRPDFGRTNRSLFFRLALPSPLIMCNEISNQFQIPPLRAIYADTASPNLMAPARQSKHSPIPFQTTVKGLEISLTTSKQRRKHFLIYGKQGFHTLHSAPTIPSEANKKLIDRPLQTESPVSNRKQTKVVLSNRYRFEGSPTSTTEINRHTELTEPAASYCKQRRPPPINCHTSRGSFPPFSLFTFTFTNHGFPHSPNAIMVTL